MKDNEPNWDETKPISF
jgi:hypothetical protein